MDTCSSESGFDALGRIPLSKLTIQDVQRLFNGQIESGASARIIQRNRSVLRAALSRAEREELVVRNVAKLVDIPAYRRKAITPWTAEQSMTFLSSAVGHRWYGAYLMLLTYGMRRGEVLGLRWSDVDLEIGAIRIEQQLQRIGKNLEAGVVKTEAGRRALPLIPIVRTALEELAEKRSASRASANPDDPLSDLVFLSSTGTPIDPKNFVRDFHKIREKAGLPRITVHHTRHTAATTLKNLGVPARDTQLILGHAHITTTQQLYQHADVEGQTRALERVGTLLTGGVAVPVAVSDELSTGESTEIDALTPGGPGGARTLDTLLKRLLILDNTYFPTPVIEHLHTRTTTYVVGWVAVQNCCTSGPNELARERLDDFLDARRQLRRTPTERLRFRSFPLSLLSTAIDNTNQTRVAGR